MIFCVCISICLFKTLSPFVLKTVMHIKNSPLMKIDRRKRSAKESDTYFWGGKVTLQRLFTKIISLPFLLIFPTVGFQHVFFLI